jgi:cytochrome c oxidase cbb3-type subunit 2
MSDSNGYIYKLNGSVVLTVIGIVCLFSAAIGVTLIAPNFLDDSWTQPCCDYQVQMYEQADPNTYISTSAAGSDELQVVNHLKDGQTLLAFADTESVRILAPPSLEKYVTRLGERNIKLTSRLLLLREPEDIATAETFQRSLQGRWKAENPDGDAGAKRMPRYQIRELYTPDKKDAFSVTESDGVLEDWVDDEYVIVDTDAPKPEEGTLYVNNPHEYRITRFKFGADEGWRYDPKGKSVESLTQLQGSELGFLSRKELIEMGERIFAGEGCHYCHTDQTRTLVQDTVLNGSEAFPAPPSSANEYIYQNVSFPGTRRIGPDLSRVGVKRPNRDWHKSHFWSPKTASVGTIMPAFRHFFDNDPRGTSKNPYGVPNYQFEAMFQYLMTKGTRISPPTKAWWAGRDPIHTVKIIEGRVSPS